jgi:hypothetical protein
MDHSFSAYSWIRLFLSDLNIVLGSTSYATPYRAAPNFNQIVCPQNFLLRNPHQQFFLKRPNSCLRAWKKTHPKICAQNFPSEQWLSRLESATNRLEFEKISSARITSPWVYPNAPDKPSQTSNTKLLHTALKLIIHLSRQLNTTNPTYTDLKIAKMFMKRPPLAMTIVLAIVMI